MLFLQCNVFTENPVNACYINLPKVFFYIKTNRQNYTQRVDAISTGNWVQFP